MSEAISAFIRKRLDFETRSRRSEFWWVQLAYILVLFIVIGLDYGVLGYSEDTTFTPFNMLLEVVLLVPMAALTTRRLHDVGLTGWAQLPLYLTYIAYIPGYEGFIFEGAEKGGAEMVLFVVFSLYSIWLLFHLVKDGQRGRNRYGGNPKASSLSDAFD